MLSTPRCFCAAVGVLALASAAAWADDWPQYRGPQRDGVWREPGIRLPDGELEPVWRAPVALGYSGPAVAAGRVYLMEYEKRSGDIQNLPDARDRLEGTERVRCLDAATGAELWRHEYDRAYFVSYGGGPRCTPTVDGDRVYTLGAEGDLRCLRTADGSLVWSKHFAADYGAPTPQWGHAAHPLVHGDTLYAMVGGEGSVVVAFDKRTGEERWRALSTPTMNHEAGYCPPTILGRLGGEDLVVFHPEGVAGLDPDSGETLWSAPLRPSYGMSIVAPLPLDGGRLFANGYENASAMLRLPTRRSGEAEAVWVGGTKDSVACSNSTPAAVGETVYGVDAGSSALMAVDATTGERLWETRAPTVGEDASRRTRHGTAFLVRRGDSNRFWLFSETGDLVLATLTPEGYEERHRRRLIEPTGETWGRPVWWSHPALADRAIFARNDRELIRVNVAKPDGG